MNFLHCVLIILLMTYPVFADKAESIQAVSLVIPNGQGGIGFDDLDFFLIYRK